MMWRTVLGLLCLVGATPSLGQEARTPDDLTAPETPAPSPRSLRTDPTAAGSNAQSSVGRTGQRQTREQIAPDTKPMTRVSNRINNRVQSRIRNRIDPAYDPQANARSPFEVAEEEARNERRR